MLEKEQLRGLYVLTDATLTPAESMLEQVERVLKSGVKVIQYRDKYASDEEAEKQCIRLQALCDVYEAIFIIDDRLEIAYRINADGLHVGEDDVSYEEARALLGDDKIIGVSCYGDLERAKKYASLGADYVAFGAFFPSPTKPHATMVAPEILQRAKEQLSVPICAIGGINAENIEQLSCYDIAMYSLISAVYKDDAIEENLEKLQAKI
ncbi:thiamine phosphate synthase [Sulfurospirillum diekertiae]|uniref:Thiamine-phosphate synthase n=1 Tax=Sulfurospirillum diekertiae TaxID=1854492 RepID=A0A290HCN8_9BACT|nr:thiamine phosphate synthase [Sulfurospirillum diekertiae]ATB69217.1 thiamine-phosphate synthase [Sulfurospirillum diekertiae]QIR76866.1 thiamine phosphate synthase [Sulfurospirillum diekertiae]QIR79484.1 thiamine phosphate synthase [Sulfurospirillum diekertiae]